MLKMLVLAALVAPLFFVTPAQAGATFSTLTKARAVHPTAHPSYRILANGQRCWYVGKRPSKRACERSMSATKAQASAFMPARLMGMAILCGGKCTRNYGTIEWRPREPVPHVTMIARFWP